ncbi:MAG: PH domain-containing protein [Bacteroidota bacterium]|nr:PH domain-containing protein [Bacteroidota bacterium]
MHFTNTEVELNNIPAAQEVELLPVHIDYLKVLRLEWLITFLVIAAALIPLLIYVQMPVTTKIVVVISAIVLLAGYWFIQEISFKYLAYSIREKDLIFQKGWIIRIFKVCPINRIQNCSVHQGPLERKFNLATLILYTAGSQGADLKIPGLTDDEANRLRQFILQKINNENEVI